jgi:hypothetical protein
MEKESSNLKVQALTSLAQVNDFDEYQAGVLNFCRQDDPEIFTRALELLSSQDESERQLGADLLGQTSAATPSDRFEALLSHLEQESDDDVLCAVINSLQFCHDDTDDGLLASRLQKYLLSERQDVVVNAIRAFPSSQVEQHLDVLLPLCRSSPSLDIGLYAANLVGCYSDVDGDEVRDALLARIALDPTCEEAYLGLSRRRDTRVVPLVLGRLKENFVHYKLLCAIREFPHVDYTVPLKSFAAYLSFLGTEVQKTLEACDPPGTRKLSNGPGPL